ncbi:MAG TPA: glycogen debranching N-terminal domain-containing protein [Dehalococcoidia bacterium]
MVHSIADAVVIKDEAIFFLCEQGGRIPVSGDHGLGLYYHDTRYLSGYELVLAGKVFNSLVASSAFGYKAVIELTNPELTEKDGVCAAKDTVGVKLTRLIDDEQLSLHDLYEFENYGTEAVELPLSFRFAADFADIFEVRSLAPQPPGKAQPPAWKDGSLRFAYLGKDGIARRTTVSMNPSPDECVHAGAKTTIKLEPEQTCELRVSMTVQESHDKNLTPSAQRKPADIDAIEKKLGHEAQQFLDDRTQVTSDDARLARTVQRSLRDLRTLRSELDGEQYFAAGVPWYVTLFGRDSIIACLQTLAFDATPAEHTLRLLAQYQGTKVDDWRDEQPGKIMHELRVGELAHLNEIPQTPYYGSIDSTPLFLILVARHACWTGSDALFHELRDNVERALRWIADYGDPAHDGYTAYESTSSHGLANQGWKDSGDAIVNADGSLGRPPIALVEVQGYVYSAKIEIAALYRRSGDTERAEQLEREAADLRARVNRDFWMDDEGTFALALQKGGEQVRVVSSNAGQALWGAIADDDKARQTAKRLLRDDMFAGWGIRTLSSDTRRYNPVGYHLGTVWPHDNSLIAAGFRRYALDDEAQRIFSGIIDAATYFDEHRLPEVFAGFARGDYDRPVHYPVACHPQAWAAGAVPYLLHACLGLEADGFEQRLKVVDPTLPKSCTELELHNVRVGKGSADLRFERAGDDVRMHVLRADGGLRVTRERRHARRDDR